MILPFAFLLLATGLTVKQDGAGLRSGCDAGDSFVTQLPAGSPIDIRFAMSGAGSTCYKVTSQVDGKPVSGYLPASAIAGLESFEQSRRTAPSLDVSQDMQKQAAAAVNGPPDHPLVRASEALRDKQPQKALDIVEQAMKVTGRDRQYLVIAGIAAYHADDAKKSLAYLKEAQQLQQDAMVASWIERLEREVKGDRSGERLYGSRFLLRYEGGGLDADLARSMVTILDDEYSRLSLQLGCRTEDRIVTIVQSPEAYRATTAATEWSGGQYDGKIRIPVASSRSIPADTRRTFAHEVVHACLSNLGQWPAWLQEGFAQKFSGESVTPARRALLRAAFHGKPPRLADLGASFSTLGRQSAEIAYSYSLLAAETLVTKYQAYGIINLLRAPERLPQVENDLDKILAEATR